MDIEQKRATRRKKLGTDTVTDNVASVAIEPNITKEIENPNQASRPIGETHMGWKLTEKGWELK